MESEIWGWPPFESLVFQDGVIGFWRLAVFVVSFFGLQGSCFCLPWVDCKLPEYRGTEGGNLLGGPWVVG